MSSPRDLMARLRACGSSFYWGVRLLPRERREAMAALYLFCRAVDDIADGDGPPADRHRALETWRACLRDPAVLCPDPDLRQVLAEAMERFDLPPEPFHAIVDGVAMDLPPGIHAPDEETFALYCRRVAGAVGLLSVRIFGVHHPVADAFALATGEALQITNILRDVAEDAARGRLYLPAPVLRTAGIETTVPSAVIGHAALPRALDTLAARAEERYDAAVRLSRDPALRPLERRRLRPGLVMLAVYRLLLRQLRRRGWGRLDERPRLGRVRLLGTVLRWRVFGA